MADEVSAEAVVLRRISFGENDRKLTLITATHGKLDVIAKGARKAGSRLAGSSDTLVLAKFTWAPGKFRKFVTQVQPYSSFPGIRTSYDKTIAALALLELISVTLPYESPLETSAEFYDLVRNSLNMFEVHQNPISVSLWFQLKLLELEGSMPLWSACAQCGKVLAVNPAWYSGIAGGHLCQDHFQSAVDRILVPAETLITLKKLTEVGEPPLNVRGVTECLNTLYATWCNLLDCPLPANLQLIQEIPAQLGTKPDRISEP